MWTDDEEFYEAIRQEEERMERQNVEEQEEDEHMDYNPVEVPDGAVVFGPAIQAPPPRPAFTCHICYRVFNKTAQKSKHIEAAHEPRKKCPKCMESFTRRDNLMRHLRAKHGIDDYSLRKIKYLRQD